METRQYFLNGIRESLLADSSPYLQYTQSIETCTTSTSSLSSNQVDVYVTHSESYSDYVSSGGSSVTTTRAPTKRPTNAPTLYNSFLVQECDNYPCSCDESINCNICQGCVQCNPDYFKKKF